MLNKYFILLPFLLLMACQNQENKTSKTDSLQVNGVDTNLNNQISPAAANLIIEGQSIGVIHLSEAMDSVVNALGKPSSSDAAMGAVLHSWFATGNGKGYRTDVYGHLHFGPADENIYRVKLIRVNSPAFKTRSHYGVGTTFNQLKRQYNLKHIANYNDSTVVKLYDDVTRGIAFEIDDKAKCVAVLVHAPADTASSYIALHPNMEWVK